MVAQVGRFGPRASAVAKGQVRSNREKKKPKADTNKIKAALRHRRSRPRALRATAAALRVNGGVVRSIACIDHGPPSLGLSAARTIAPTSRRSRRPYPLENEPVPCIPRAFRT